MLEKNAHIPINTLRRLVGNSSAPNTYIIVNDAVIVNFATIATVIEAHSTPESNNNKNGVKV